MQPKTKPTITGYTLAEQQNQHKHIKYADFNAPGEGRAGQLELRNLGNRLLVIAYNLGANVKVAVDPDDLELTEHNWKRLEAIIEERKARGESRKAGAAAVNARRAGELAGKAQEPQDA